ncbi:hypothetical protein CITSP_02992 [Citrobacter sp. T1.2D-1]|nr:hypothetical protein CITSP_02992 [Citrobacter sp. T1.2D-1]
MKGRNQLLRQYPSQRRRRKQQAGEKSQQQNTGGGHQGFKRVFHGIVKLELKKPLSGIFPANANPLRLPCPDLTMFFHQSDERTAPGDKLTHCLRFIEVVFHLAG